MFDFGWTELVVVIIVAVFAFGPKEVPQLLYNLGRIARRLHYMRYALSQQFEDFMMKAEQQHEASANVKIIPAAPEPEEIEDEEDRAMIEETMKPKVHDDKQP